MTTINLVKPNRYQDSVTLMQMAVSLRALEGIGEASLMMGTDPNKEILGEAGLLAPDGERAGPNDLIIALRGETSAVEAAQGKIEELLRAGTPQEADREPGAAAPHTIAGGIAALPAANLVLISTPGLYAAAEARKALLQSRHVMIFSDNVSIGDEIALKTLASERGLLLMGPDCGTAIIGGVPLGFANAVRRGSIGVVGASGTGMQEVTSLIDRYGEGISHAIGTGSRDLSELVGGAMTLVGMRALLDDPQTSVVVVVSKPPHPGVAARIWEAALRADKPIVFCFLGMDASRVDRSQGSGKAVMADTLEEAARRAVALVGGSLPPTTGSTDEDIRDWKGQLAPSQRYVRGLFSGGTFCYEAMLILRPTLGPIYSNTPLVPELKLDVRDPHAALDTTHACLDLGADEFTVGRPHPMIDMTARAERIMAEAADPKVAVLLLDIVLGYGSHPDPAGALAEAISSARALAAADGRGLAVVASVCGTNADPQGLETQRKKLASAGVILAESNAAAARLASKIAAPIQG